MALHFAHGNNLIFFVFSTLVYVKLLLLWLVVLVADYFLEFRFVLIIGIECKALFSVFFCMGDRPRNRP